tara:strand:+ start:4709 stop:5662 length:954 start_codon:yes stop_codon:yes gene_type:complete
MRIAPLFAVFVTSVTVLTLNVVAENPDDWKSRVMTSPPGEFPLLPPCLLTFNVNWNGLVKAGQADAVFRYDESASRLIVTAKARSTGPARLLWAYDANQTTWIDTERLLPIKVSQVEDDRRETNIYNTEFVGDFAFNQWTTEAKSDESESIERKERIFEQAAMHDLVSAALYLRSQPLDELGQEFALVTFPFRDPYLVLLTLSAKEKRKFDGEKIDAIKFDVQLSKVDEEGRLESQRDKFHSASVWLSDDERRLPLELRSEIFIGSVRASLVDFTPFDKSAGNSATNGSRAVELGEVSEGIREKARGIVARLRKGGS